MKCQRRGEQVGPGPRELLDRLVDQVPEVAEALGKGGGHGPGANFRARHWKSTRTGAAVSLKCGMCDSRRSKGPGRRGSAVQLASRPWQPFSSASVKFAAYGRAAPSL